MEEIFGKTLNGGSIKVNVTDCLISSEITQEYNGSASALFNEPDIEDIITFKSINHNGYISLIDNYIVKLDRILSERITEIIKFESQIFINGHSPYSHEILFDRIKFSVSNHTLSLPYKKHKTNNYYRYGDKNREKNIFYMRYNMNKSMIFKFNCDEVDVRSYSQLNLDESNNDSLFSEEKIVDIVYKNPKSLLECLKDADTICDIISIYSGISSEPISITGQSQDKKNQFGHKLFHISRVSEKTRIYSRDVLYDTIKSPLISNDEYQKNVKIAYMNKKTNALAYQILATTIKRETPFTKHRLLDACSMFESLANSHKTKNSISKPTLKRATTAAHKEINQENENVDINRISSLLSKINETSLKQKIEITTTYIENKIGNDPVVSHIRNSHKIITDCRNGMTHGSVGQNIKQNDVINSTISLELLSFLLAFSECEYLIQSLRSAGRHPLGRTYDHLLSLAHLSSTTPN